MPWFPPIGKAFFIWYFKKAEFVVKIFVLTIIKNRLDLLTISAIVDICITKKANPE